MNKKAQITIFMIAGIALVIIIGVLIYTKTISVEKIIKPLILALNGDKTQLDRFRKTEPTEEHLVTAMEMYSRDLETSC